MKNAPTFARNAPVLGRENLSVRVSEFLVDHIRRNRLKSGDKVPSEIQASTTLKISRGIVREAYRSLQAAGVIEIESGRRPRVGALKNTAFTQLLRHALSTQQASTDESLDLRQAVEVRAAELAAVRRNDDQISMLRNAADGMRRTQKTPDDFVQYDIQFHQVIGEATGNILFQLVSGGLRESLETSIRAGLERRTTQTQLERVVETHEAIVDAIEAQQSTRAGYLMTIHFDEAKNALRGLFPDQPKIKDIRQGNLVGVA